MVQFYAMDYHGNRLILMLLPVVDFVPGQYHRRARSLRTLHFDEVMLSVLFAFIVIGSIGGRVGKVPVPLLFQFLLGSCHRVELGYPTNFRVGLEAGGALLNVEAVVLGPRSRTDS